MRPTIPPSARAQFAPHPTTYWAGPWAYDDDITTHTARLDVALRQGRELLAIAQKSTVPPKSDPDMERFEKDVREAGEYEARLAELARKILAPLPSKDES